MLTKTKTKPLAAPLGRSRAQALWEERSRLVSSGSAAYSSIVIDHAQNATVWDVDGKSYVDFAGGIGAVNVGHCHPKVVAALREQAGKLLHTAFHVAAYENYIRAADELVKAVPGARPQKTLFFNSGSEAVENAVKFARAYTKRKGVISFQNCFHGRTLLCLTLDGKHKPLRQGFGPCPTEIYHAPYPNAYRPPKGLAVQDLTDYCLDELERLMTTATAPEDVAAIIAEPVQGEGGFIAPTPGFWVGLRKLCDRHGILLIADEVQTGFGRTGEMFAIEHEKVVPDLMTIGKSIAAGMPLSAVAGRADILDAAPVGSVGGTYGGNPMACAAALAVFDIFREERLVDKARTIGAAVKERFDSFAEKFPFVGDSRGLGAMRAIELVSDKKTKAPLPAVRVKEIIHHCADKGLMVLKAGAHDNVIRTLMPLTIPEKDLSRGLDILEESLKEFNP